MGSREYQNTSAGLGSFVGGLGNEHLQLAELSYQGAGEGGMKNQLSWELVPLCATRPSPPGPTLCFHLHIVPLQLLDFFL